MACLPSNRSAEPGSLVVRMDFWQAAAELLAAEPRYLLRNGSLCSYERGEVLVRLSRVNSDIVAGLAWYGVQIPFSTK